MTTVAFDGKTLAADRQVTVGNAKFSSCKIFKLNKHSFCAITGNVVHAMMLIDKFKDGAVEISIPEDSDAEIVLFNARTGKVYVIGSGLVPIEFDAPFAYGSGGHAAMGCMMMGGTAIEAVQIASQVDAWTGLGVDSVDKSGIIKTVMKK